MSRTYAAKRLLEHGPLTFSQFWEITGWTCDEAWHAIRSLVRSGVATFHNKGRHRVYRLAAAMVVTQGQVQLVPILAVEFGDE